MAVNQVLSRAPVGSATALKVWGSAIIAIVPLVGAAWLPPGLPHFLRQVLLWVWGVGAILLLERLLFSGTVRNALRSLGFVRARRSTVVAALLTSLPIWAFLPTLAWISDSVVALRPDWVQVLVGVMLVNGITEEAIHRGFVFGHLRRGRSFAAAATSSALLFAAQHLYIIVTTDWMVGSAAVILAALVAYPMASLFESGGNSIAAPAILHTSTNAPVLVLALTDEFMATALVPHMGVIVASLYVLFAVQRRIVGKPAETSV
jgi:membrane protease YdiL (CAAX protease family)